MSTIEDLYKHAENNLNELHERLKRDGTIKWFEDYENLMFSKYIDNLIKAISKTIFK